MKRMIISMLFVSLMLNSNAQQLVVELAYNVNGYQHSALCVFEGGWHGRCNVLSPFGNCWFDAVTESEGDGYVISMSNPSKSNWIPGVCHLRAYNPYVEFQGLRYRLTFAVIGEGYHEFKKAQYGFSISNTPFEANKPVTVTDAPCRDAGCHCRAYKGYRTPAGSYTGQCQNSDGWGHTCNHGPKAHGL